MLRIIAAAALLSATAAAAATHKPLPPPTESQVHDIEDTLRSIDANNDGQYTRAEWLATGRQAKTFDTLDHNRDGVLTNQEIRSGYRLLDLPKSALPKARY